MTTNTTSSPTPRIVRVETVTESWGSEGDHLVVRPYWGGVHVDRPEGVGYAVRDMKIAKRLERAMLAQIVFANAEVATDVNGRTYVAASSRVLGRTLNADLRKLGF